METPKKIVFVLRIMQAQNKTQYASLKCIYRGLGAKLL